MTHHRGNLQSPRLCARDGEVRRRNPFARSRTFRSPTASEKAPSHAASTFASRRRASACAPPEEGPSKCRICKSPGGSDRSRQRWPWGGQRSSWGSRVAILAWRGRGGILAAQMMASFEDSPSPDPATPSAPGQEPARPPHTGIMPITCDLAIFQMRIPIYSGRIFRREAGRGSDLKPASIPR